MQNYPEVDINIFESSYTKSQELQFAQIEFNNTKQLVDYLIALQMTEDAIIKQVI